MSLRSPFTRLLTVTCVVGAVVSCGGSNTSPATASNATSTTEDDNEDFAEDSSDHGEPESSAAVDPCAGGTCTTCGESVCLDGFFCAESTQSCSWVPACAEDPTCGCLQKALPDCSCSERDGGLYVSCD